MGRYFGLRIYRVNNQVLNHCILHMPVGMSIYIRKSAMASERCHIGWEPACISARILAPSELAEEAYAGLFSLD